MPQQDKALTDPTVLDGPIDGMKVPIPWGGKTGTLILEKVKIPVGLTLHKIIVDYDTINQYGNITGGSITKINHYTYTINNDQLENIAYGNYKYSSDENVFVSYLSPNDISTILQNNAYTAKLETDDDIYGSGALYSNSSFEMINTFKVESAKTVKPVLIS